VLEVELQAVLTQRSEQLKWQALCDKDHWKFTVGTPRKNLCKLFDLYTFESMMNYVVQK
jgi:hypothetical protein